MVVGCAIFFTVNIVSINGIVSIAEKESFRKLISNQFEFWMFVWAGSVAVGLLAAIGGTAFPWASLLAAVPVVVLHISLSNTLRARRDRERVDGLFQAAMHAHSSVQVSDVEESVTTSARELLRSRESKISDQPPAEDEIGAKLAVKSDKEQWLVVSNPRGVEPFDERDRNVLNALVAVGSNAIENARLVEEIKHHAFHDTLTGLPNQMLFEERAGFSIAQANRTGERVAFLFIDIDRLKKVNDVLGHGAGNELLKQVAERLLREVRFSDTVARMSGDEFTVLLTGIRKDGAMSAVEKILHSFEKPFMIGKRELFITPSIGMSLYPDDGIRVETLVKNADAAMYRAKARGGNTFHAYTPDINKLSYDPLTLERDLHKALKQEDLLVYYQPKVEVRSGRVVGAEALARWNHPELGFVSPDIFIPLAEEIGVIAELDSWILSTACRQTVEWNEHKKLKIAANLSGRLFHNGRLVESVSDTLMSTGLDPSQLELEVTERIAVDESGEALATLEALRDLGVHVAIDDFGTGYSMLSRLLKFPIDTLKIDRSLTSEISEEVENAPIMTALIAMAHGLGLEVVAEGVETEKQWEVLDRLGCDHAQGYFFSKPVDAQSFGEMLSSTTERASLRAV